ncbi:hypothetical protein [Streptomyces sp. TLI_105]|uniref:hypothetical protein n=1 Tax=Streptomyces sp. TLI_105 TaxID=1881019 RepID=UPI0008979F80|nr:hypothetical protein [Streptomyces sp. TLI_105]SED24052.1 hypothetical protein SAMN05428939_4626 [Streptomyces sp. TLI_105]
MGNSRAYAVFRTTDADEAYARARRLVALLAEVEDEAYVEAEVRTVGEARRIARLLPDAAVDRVEAACDPVTGEYLDLDLVLDAAGDDEIRAELPLCLSAEVPAATVGPELVRALGDGPSGVDWHGRWPDDPETGARGFGKYDGVQLVLHGDRARIDAWTPHHTVFLHLDKWADLPRARKLAARAGCEVLGDVQIGW